MMIIALIYHKQPLPWAGSVLYCQTTVTDSSRAPWCIIIVYSHLLNHTCSIQSRNKFNLTLALLYPRCSHLIGMPSVTRLVCCLKVIDFGRICFKFQIRNQKILHVRSDLSVINKSVGRVGGSSHCANLNFNSFQEKNHFQVCKINSYFRC